MKISYEKTATNSFQGYDWIMYDDLSGKDSLIFYEFKNLLKETPHLPFDSLEVYLKDRYNHRRSKSSCRITTFKNTASIEITKPNKVLPKIWIVKV